MQERANKFIETLEAAGLLSPEIVDELRKHVQDSKTQLKPELLAKLLVDNGHLTKFQATKLIAEMTDEPAEATAAAAGNAASAGASNDDLTFADDNAQADSVETVPVVESVEAVDTVEVIESVETVQAVEAIETVTAVEEAVPVAAVEEPQSGVFDSDSRSKPKTTKVVRPPTPNNSWESMRIILVGTLLALVCIVGAALVWYFMKGNADEILERAKERYEQRSYETAGDIYEKFAEQWPQHEQASFAQVRSVLAKIRNAVENTPNPKKGLETAQELLPDIAEEKGLTDQRDDLAGVLVNLSTKFLERADSRETIEERKEVMAQLDELMKLLNDPRFVGKAQREKQRVVLDENLESQNRIKREIGRDEYLASTLTEIDKLLEAGDTPGMYLKRDELTRKYPSLEANEQLGERVLRACQIQLSQVAESALEPSVSKDDPYKLSAKSFVLGHRDGGEASDLRDYTVFIRAKGSIYGLNGEDGTLLWSRFIGRGFDSDPVRIGEKSSTDALICVPAKGHVLRVDGKTGNIEWFADFKTKIHSPVFEGEDLIVASHAGDVVSLDLQSGSVLWSKKIPQELTVAPAIAFQKDYLYLPAAHTSMYVLQRSSGECRDVIYTGHRPGSVAVSPIVHLGQLFFFENTDSQNGKIRFFNISVDDQSKLSEDQQSAKVNGNIVVGPEVDGRRLLVQSDLGQIQAFDVEISAKKDKVANVATRGANVLSPRLSWFTAKESKVWLADSRLYLLNLQESSQQFTRAKWSKHDGDAFQGAPLKIEDTIVHVRTIRGNRGLRVTAADAETGEMIWESDIGVPVTLLTENGSGLVAVNSGANLFNLTNEQIRSSADQNAGKDRVSLDFESPVSLGPNRQVMFNLSKANQLANLNGNDLRLLSANFGGANLACPVIAVGDKVGVALENGQFMLIDPTNGSNASSPYQLPMKPGQKIKWNTPLYIESANSIIIANDKQKLVRLSDGDSLRALTTVDIESPLVGPIVQAGKSVAAVASTKSGDTLLVFNPTSLKSTGRLALPGRLISGPYGQDDGCLVHTDQGLQLISSEAKQVWAIRFPTAAIVGAPQMVDGKLIVATVMGQIWIIEAQTGTVEANVDVGQAFSSSPLITPQGVVVGTEEGTVLAIPMPTSKTIP